MTWKSPPPDDAPREGPWPEDDGTDTTASQDRLHRIERRLSSLRPRAPRLGAEDWEAIRAAAGEPTATEPAAASLSLTASPRDALRRPVPMIVGSWTCGALAGALAMFLLMTTLQPSGERGQPAAGTHVVADTDDASAADDSNPASISEPAADAPKAVEHPRRVRDVPRSTREEEALVAMITDPLGAGSASRFAGTPTPRAGMLLRSVRDAWMQEPAAPMLAGNGAGSGGPSFGGAGSSSSSAFVSAPEITRQRILDELLSEGGWSTF